MSQASEELSERRHCILRSYKATKLRNRRSASASARKKLLSVVIMSSRVSFQFDVIMSFQNEYIYYISVVRTLRQNHITNHGAQSRQQNHVNTFAQSTQ